MRAATRSSADATFSCGSSGGARLPPTVAISRVQHAEHAEHSARLSAGASTTLVWLAASTSCLATASPSCRGSSRELPSLASLRTGIHAASCAGDARRTRSMCTGCFGSCARGVGGGARVSSRETRWRARGGRERTGAHRRDDCVQLLALERHAVDGNHAVEQPQPALDSALLEPGNCVEVVEEEAELPIGRTAANVNDARLTVELAQAHRRRRAFRLVDDFWRADWPGAIWIFGARNWPAILVQLYYISLAQEIAEALGLSVAADPRE